MNNLLGIGGESLVIQREEEPGQFLAFKIIPLDELDKNRIKFNKII